jgi:hypothetical protein
MRAKNDPRQKNWSIDPINLFAAEHMVNL